MAPNVEQERVLSIISCFSLLSNYLMLDYLVAEDELEQLEVTTRRLTRRRALIMSSIVGILQSSRSVRRVWKFKKGLWFETILPHLPNESFRMHFRMSRENYCKLVSDLGVRLQKTYAVRAPIPVEKRVAAAVFRLCSSCELRTVAELFGIGISTIHVLVDEFIDAVIKQYYRRYIQFPEGNELNIIAEGFENMCGFPMAVGAIDGCHIPISPPSAKAVDYYNFKGWYSMILFAVVDNRYKFRYISIGHPGRNHDAFIFASSALKRSVIDAGLLNVKTVPLSGTQVPFLLLGDSAFPLLRNVMKPFPQKGSLSPAQCCFNQSLCSGRRVVENAFGRLKARFRILGKRLEMKSLPRMKKTIKACCTLHNLLESWQDQIEQVWLSQEETSNVLQPSRVSNRQSDLGVQVRAAIANHLLAKD